MVLLDLREQLDNPEMSAHQDHQEVKVILGQRVKLDRLDLQANLVQQVQVEHLVISDQLEVLDNKVVQVQQDLLVPLEIKVQAEIMDSQGHRALKEIEDHWALPETQDRRVRKGLREQLAELERLDQPANRDLLVQVAHQVQQAQQDLQAPLG